MSARQLLALTILCLTATLLAPAIANADGSRRIVIAGADSPTPGEHRLALVIGNTHYGGANELKNPENDARAIASAFSKLGFTSTLLLDADRAGLRDAVHDFRNAILQAGPQTVALLYYSGHGMQVNGKNYLVPIGFEAPRDPEDMDEFAYPMQKALDEMQAARARTNIVILDACRNNPFAETRAWGGRGLAKMEPDGIYVAYATGEGNTASDNASGTNGLYTQELLKVLETPGKDIHQVFMAVRQGVYAASDGAQRPYDYDGLLSDDFYFVGSSPRTSIVASSGTFTLAHLLTGHTGVARVCFSSDGRRIASGSDDGTVKLWDASTGQCIRTFTGHASNVLAVCFSPDGKRIASASWDNTIKLWDTDSGECLQTLTGHTNAVWSVRYSPDGRRIASAGNDNTIKVWDADTGRCLQTLTGHSNNVLTVCFSPDGKCLASASADKTVKIWNLETNQCIKTLSGHTNCAIFVCYSPDGKRIASASWDKTVKLWDADTGQCLQTYTEHTGVVSSVCFSPDGKRVASASGDKTVKVWDVDNGQCVQTLPLADDGISVAFSCDGAHLVTGSKDGQVRIYDVEVP